MNDCAESLKKRYDVVEIEVIFEAIKKQYNNSNSRTTRKESYKILSCLSMHVNIMNSKEEFSRLKHLLLLRIKRAWNKNLIGDKALMKNSIQKLEEILASIIVGIPNKTNIMNLKKALELNIDNNINYHSIASEKKKNDFKKLVTSDIDLFFKFLFFKFSLIDYNRFLERETTEIKTSVL